MWLLVCLGWPAGHLLVISAHHQHLCSLCRKDVYFHKASVVCQTSAVVSDHSHFFPIKGHGNKFSKIDNEHKLKWGLWFSLKPVLIFESNINLNLPLIAVSLSLGLTYAYPASRTVDAVIASYCLVQTNMIWNSSEPFLLDFPHTHPHWLSRPECECSNEIL